MSEKTQRDLHDALVEINNYLQNFEMSVDNRYALTQAVRTIMKIIKRYA